MAYPIKTASQIVEVCEANDYNQQPQDVAVAPDLLYAMRAIKSKGNRNEVPSASGSIPFKKKQAKRKCISIACIPCRKRKSKCDGTKPDCSTCTAVYHTRCSYGLDSDQRPKGALKRDADSLLEQNGTLGIILASIRSSTDIEAAEIVQQIRADEDLDQLADTLKMRTSLPERIDAKGAEGELANLIGKSAFDKGVVKHYGSTSSLALVPDREQTPPQRHRIGSWTAVTQDQDFVRHLLNLYFCWSHPVYLLFSKEMFLHDMANGLGKHCSSLLVNAVLALGCSFSDRPEARTDPSDPATAGDHFFAEAKRLLDSSESCLTAVQALAVMGLREAGFDHDSAGFQYAGRCIRMAIELGLHLAVGADESRSRTSEAEARKITFWGCFVIDTSWSICIGRISQLPRAATNLEMPKISDKIELKPWQPCPEYDYPVLSEAEKPSYVYTMLTQQSLLSEIVNDTVFMFYAPRERFTSWKLLELHNRYTRWYSRLPSQLCLQEASPAQMYTLHLYYHTMVLHLFRPFLRIDLTNSKVSPREVCTSCAATIHSTLFNYKRIYGFRRFSLILAHTILSSNIIDLVNLPDSSAAQHLEFGISSLREMGEIYPFATRAHNVLIALAKQWNKALPAGIDLSAPGTMSPAPSEQNHSSDNTQYSAHPSTNRTQTIVPADYEAQLSEVAFNSVKDSSRTSLSPAEIFWSPFPEVSVPLQGLQPTGPMDISNVIDTQYANDWIQFSKDGFKMADVSDALSTHGELAPNHGWP